MPYHNPYSACDGTCSQGRQCTCTRRPAPASPAPIPWEEWMQEGMRRFGPVHDDWKFVCPACGYVASVRDWRMAGAEEGHIAFSCIGRLLPKHLRREAFGTARNNRRPGPCNYAGGGFLACNPVMVNQGGVVRATFAFAEPEVPRA